MSDTADVLVVGAGPTGLLLAAELVRHGVRARIIDRSKGPSEKSKALVIQTRSLEILDSIGVLNRFTEIGHRVFAINVFADGKRIVHVSTDGLDTPHPYALALPQFDTESILIRQLAELGVEVERELTLTGLSQDGEAAEAVLVDARGKEQRWRGPWVVGCDGAHSAVRRALDLPFAGTDLEVPFVFADVRMACELPDDESYAFFSPDGVLACIPLPRLGDAYWRVVASMPPGGVPGELSLGLFQELVDTRARIRATLAEPVWMTSFSVRQRKVDTYRRGRVFLAGDAAHCHSPVGGQGMNTGLQDAYNLAWKLGLVQRGLGVPALLDSYEREREPVAAALLQGTEQATRAVTLRNPIAQALRNQVARFLSSLETVRQRLALTLGELDLTYRRSPIVVEDRSSLLATHMVASANIETPSLGQWREFSSGPRAGDRAPDVALAEGAPRARLFELLRGTGHCLLLFDGSAPTPEGYANLARIAGQVSERYGDRVAVHIVVPGAGKPAQLDWDGSLLLDPGRALHERYGASAECLYLIRPDGYIGYRAQPADGDRLLAYLRGIFL